ncbi:hypothetical protein [Limnospira platensis]|uniref:hypothetical protein n=1 Tax=Limnospira platensis TaxID=118562 RepID=UPI000AD4AAF2
MARLPVGDRIPPPPRRHLNPEAIVPHPGKSSKKGCYKMWVNRIYDPYSEALSLY